MMGMYQIYVQKAREMGWRINAKGFKAFLLQVRAGKRDRYGNLRWPL